ncbi:MAG: hypothetical protein GC150_14630 [Rhizobiales bacterium]|nr:hypothetical protein [Hyphomicrobiales bacterium]
MTGRQADLRRPFPWHLWAVGFVGLAWNAFGAFDYVMTVTKHAGYLAQFPPEMIDYWLAMPWWVYAIWGTGLFAGIAGSLALLLRRRIAIPVLTLSLFAATVSLVLGLVDPDAPRMDGQEAVSAVIVAVALLLPFYAVVLSRRGILR